MECSDELEKRYRTLSIKKLTGADSGITKKAYFEYINKTLETCNVCIFSIVIESGIGIRIPVNKIYGVRSAMSNSQRAFLHMIARCRHVSELVISLKKYAHVYINNNYNFWIYTDV